eukprot:gene62228-85104_t
MSGHSHDHTHPHDHAHDHSHDHDPDRWKHDGIRVIPADNLDTNVPSTKGMDRAAAINFARVGAQKLWAGTVSIQPDAKTGAHHHGHLESVIYVVKGKARMRWGDRLQFTAEAGPGDFIFVPPYVPHQEINASPDEALASLGLQRNVVATVGGFMAALAIARSTDLVACVPDRHTQNLRSGLHSFALAFPV